MTEKKRKKQPVVVLAGHIDHGKTSLLESVKDLKILDQEAGGITQRISSYEIEQEGEKITFIDTPGHAAFSAMRARGAEVADIAVLVVAADEGVEEQTREVIKALKETGTPIIVAITKMDKPNAEPEKVKSQLAEEEVVVEDRGGEVPVVETSAETGEGVEELLEVILLVSEVEDFKARPEAPPRGVIIESRLCSRRGPLSTLLVKEGILEEGDLMGTETSFGRVRRIEDFKGERVSKRKPGQTALVLGFKKIPRMGEPFRVYESLEKAKEGIVEKKRKKVSGSVGKKKKVLNLILKTDVSGSLKPVKKVVKELPQERVSLRVLREEVGEVSLGDVERAETCQAVVIGFRVGVLPVAEKKAEELGVEVFTFDVIYELKQALKRIMEQFLGPQKMRANLAKLKVLAIFKRGKRRQVVGARVERGEVRKGNKLEVFRLEGEEKVEAGKGRGKGRIVGLEQNKKEIKKGREGDEVGILYEGEGEIEKGDVLIAYEIREKRIEL